MDKSSFLLFLITTVWISQAIACDSDCLLRCFVKCSVPDEGGKCIQKCFTNCCKNNITRDKLTD